MTEPTAALGTFACPLTGLDPKRFQFTELRDHSFYISLALQVQIIPWMLGDSNYLPRPMQWLDPRKTVFVGALHGMLNAEGLATIFGDLFGGEKKLAVCYN